MAILKKDKSYTREEILEAIRDAADTVGEDLYQNAITLIEEEKEREQLIIAKHNAMVETMHEFYAGIVHYLSIEGEVKEEFANGNSR